jgi:hypothetical protein
MKTLTPTAVCVAALLLTCSSQADVFYTYTGNDFTSTSFQQEISTDLGVATSVATVATSPLQAEAVGEYNAETESQNGHSGISVAGPRGKQ